jgi:hypothetical protein
MKKIAIIIGTCISALSIQAHANTPSSNDVVRDAMEKEGFTLEKGALLIPAAKIVSPNDLKSLWKAERPSQNNLNRLWQTAEVPSKDNNDSSLFSERAEALLQMGETVQENDPYNANNPNSDSAVLRKSISDIHMAYSFVPAPDRDVLKHYGFAACGTFNQGWTGVAEFFQNKKLGNCAYTEYNFTLAHAAAKVDEKVARDDVNHKITTVHVEGNNDSGYVYTVAWLDDSFFRTLECASTRYAPDTTAQVIALAQRIDNQ